LRHSGSQGILVLSYVDYPSYVGLSRRISGILNSLHSSNIPYQVISPIFRSPDAPDLPQATRVDLRFLRALGPDRLVTKILALIFFSLFAFVKILVLRKEILAVQYESIYSFPSAFLARMFCRCPIIGDDVLILRSSRLSRLLASVVIATTDLILSSTEATLLRSSEPGRILYVPNGINTDFVLNRSSMSFDKIRAVFTGTMSYQSNREAALHLLELASKLPKECKIQIQIIGGPVPKELASNGKVRFLGQLDDPSLLEIYKDANVGILPFFGIPAEGPKVKVLEYAAAQLLVISSPEGVQGYRDFVPWKHYVPVDSFREMIEVMSDILRAPNFHAEIAKRGQRLAMTRYKWPDLLSPYLNLMQKLRTEFD